MGFMDFIDQQIEKQGPQSPAAAADASGPARDAKRAHERGDQYFQVAMPLSARKGSVYWHMPTSSERTNDAAGDVVNAIARTGWRLLDTTMAFVPVAETSRDKFLKSGQQTAITGEMVCSYTFERVG